MLSRSLATKLSVPAAPRGLVRRQRLLNRLDEGAARRLTLVSAPAGSGKTTLLAEFASATHLPVAWVSLDARDDDPHRFWSSIVGALDRLRPEATSSALPAAAEDALVEWVDEVVLGIAADFLLVLDDFHHVARPSLHRGLAFLLDYAPPTLHLAIGTRKDPLLPLATLRARGQLAEVRADDLSFTHQESAELLGAIAGRDLPSEAVETLQAKTEGWAASVQLAGLAMRDRTDPVEVASAFSGSHRYVVDYLAEEVFLRQSDDVRQFLVETAILDRLCGPLCDAVTERADGRDVLEALERGNLFLVPLGDDRSWYRYHHLFAGFLRARLASTPPSYEAELHRRAASWLERQGDVVEAFDHWLAAGDEDGAAVLIERQGQDMVNRGELRRLTDWFGKLPARIIDQRPALGLKHAWMLVVSERPATVFRQIDRAEERIAASSDLSVDERSALWAEAMAVRATVESRHGDPARARELALMAHRELPASEGWTRAFNHLTIALASLQLDDIPAAQTAYRDALVDARESGNYHAVYPSYHNQVEILVRSGRLREAMRMCLEALRDGRSGAAALPVSAELHADAAEIHCQRNDLDMAAELAEHAVTLSRRWGLPESIVRCQTSLAGICRVRGHLERARSLFADVERTMISGQFRHPQSERRWAAFRLRWWIAERQLGRAASLAVELGLTEATAPTYLNEGELLGLARLLRAEGQAAAASGLLDRLARAAASAGRAGRQIEARVLGSLALADQRRDTAALASLREALALAEPEGYVRVFLDEGQPLVRLLETASAEPDPVTADYADRLLAAFGQEHSRGAAGLLEPLSGRELEILRLIARGKTYQEIALELVVAVSTVQHHVRSLYPKLDAHSGLEAVARARQLGLLP